MSARFTMSLAAACAPSRSTLRESESGAPVRIALLFVACLASTKRRSSRLALHPDCTPARTRRTSSEAPNTKPRKHYKAPVKQQQQQHQHEYVHPPETQRQTDFLLRHESAGDA